MSSHTEPAPSARLSEPIVSEASTTFAVADLADGTPRSGRVVLGQEALLYATDEDYLRLDLADVNDVAIDYIPEGLQRRFESTVGVSYRRNGRTRVSVVELSGHQQIEFANRLLELALDGVDVVLTHPTRIDGRVTNNPPQPGRLAFQEGELLVRADGETAFRTLLADLTAVEQGRQAVPDGMNSALSLRYSRNDSEMVTKLSTGDDRLFTLFDRRVREGFQRIKATVQQLSLSSTQKELLAALYLKPPSRRLSTVVERPPNELEDILSGLELHNLVARRAGGPELTEIGESTIESVMSSEKGARFAVFQSS